MSEPTRIVVVPYGVDFLSSPAGFAWIVAMIVAGIVAYLLSKIMPKAGAEVFLFVCGAAVIGTMWAILS